jgi:hypothetical protein
MSSLEYKLPTPNHYYASLLYAVCSRSHINDVVQALSTFCDYLIRPLACHECHKLFCFPLDLDEQ